MGFLHRAATTRSSTPSPSRSPTNCGGPATSEQLSPNSLWTYSSVTAGEGAVACPGGGGGCFFDWAASVADAAEITNNASTTRREAIWEDDMLLTVIPIFPAWVETSMVTGNEGTRYFRKCSHPMGRSSLPVPSTFLRKIFRRRCWKSR